MVLNLRDYPELSAAFLARHPADDPRFEPWLEAWYGTPVVENELFREPEDDGLGDDRETFTVFAALSWSLGGALFERFSPGQVGETVWSLQNLLPWPTKPEEGERLMWDAVEILFEEAFSPYALDALCHLSEPNPEVGGALYMFWDVAHWRPHRATEFGRDAFLRHIERGLASSKAAMQESAIHGIGEYTPYNGEGTGAIPEAAALARRFIAEGVTSRPELFDYADKAARGMVQ